MENIHEKVFSTLERLSLKNKILSITVDNGRNVVSGMNKLAEHLESINVNCLIIRCAAHSLNLIVKEGLSSSKIILEKIRNLSISVRVSSKKRQSFFNLAKTKDLEILPIMDVQTRWNSTYLMLERALQLKYISILFEFQEKMDSISENEWNDLQSIHILLQGFYEATLALEASIYPTISNALVIFAVLRQNLVNFKDSSVDVIRNMVNSIYSKLQEYWSNIISLPCVVAAVLDPRIKLKLLSDEQTKCVIDMMNEIDTALAKKI